MDRQRSSPFDEDDELPADQLVVDALLADELLVDSLGDVLHVCAALRECRLGAGFSIADVAARGGGDAHAIAGIDDGDLAAPVEAFAYYAVALGFELRIALSTPAGEHDG